MLGRKMFIKLRYGERSYNIPHLIAGFDGFLHQPLDHRENAFEIEALDLKTQKKKVTKQTHTNTVCRGENVFEIGDRL